MNKDTWERASSVAEIVSSAAILLTLVYLAVQTNQISQQTALSNAALLSAARQESLNAELGLIYQFAAAAPIEVQDFDSLPADQRTRYSTLVIAAIRVRESLWWQNRNGVLDDATWVSYRNLLLRSMVTDKSWRTVWEETKGDYDPDFVREIDMLRSQQADPQ